MSDFMERARAEAVRRTRSPGISGQALPSMDQLAERDGLRRGFGAGADWARDVLLADPTDAEVETVAEALVAERYRMHGVDLEKAKSSGAMWQLDIEFLRPQARAAIAAFLAKRRGSE